MGGEPQSVRMMPERNVLVRVLCMVIILTPVIILRVTCGTQGAADQFEMYKYTERLT